jgi:uncharacterized membrane protein
MGIDLPRHPVVRGHPIHAILSDLPVTLIPLALATELAGVLGSRGRRRRRRRANVSDAVTRLALIAAGTAGIAGWIDWLTIPREHAAQRPATLHGLINSAGVLALLGAASRPRLRLPLLGGAAAGVAVAGWIGGDLVFHHGWRVRPAEEAEMVAAKVGQDPFEQARREIERFEREKTFLHG